MKALISVSDKTGVVEFAKGLVALGWEILSTSGTMKLLKESGVPVTSVSDVTGFPEICDGRVKTLHPKIHGALLARRDIPEHMKELKDNDIDTIDLVCVNLYPFRETIAKPDVTMEDAVEHIDIGGPSMLRSAAKNWESVTVVCNPADYETILSEIKADGNTTRETRLKLSAKAYTHTAEYDMAISTYMRAQAGLPEKLFLEYDLKQELRYGENPHQEAKFFASTVKEPFSLATAEQLNGKELSYNNIQDANATLNIAREFDEPFCVGVKHMNPCGSATGKTIAEAWKKAYEAGAIILADRYTTSNMVHQAVKLTDREERESFLDWLWDFEFNKLGLPVPDKVVFLDMDPEVADQLIAARAAAQAQERDIHERDKEYLHRCHAAYEELAKKYGWTRVACSEHGEPRAVEAIHADVYAAIMPLLEGME